MGIIDAVRAWFRRNYGGCRVCHAPIKGRPSAYCSPACVEAAEDLATW